ncbi:TAXI family TRAP transporter solute-binding subunit [Rhodobacteraceae bacterium 2CG4]|uniref:TAXI family TRAP transporter solute-binding subunit n=1 Tax=Halovulum marinum TaxID=2662447 RepID=A0A6L5YY52_9RHOB|nr:TAXI family TRAP transporter solute-binding subunit [Halovulum marinum]MSU88614.1 TAXI family TRAP transporter solute-binding subunit [Halovulum marinum]
MGPIKRIAAGAAVCLTVLGTALPAAAEELRIGTASLGGAFYPVGQAISNLVNKHADGLTMVPVVTQGGTENPRLIGNGEVDVAIGNANTSFYAFKGQEPYADAIDLRALGTLHSSILHIATLAGSDIQSIPDLKGKRVAVGPAGGGTINLLRNVLEAYDMEFSDIEPSFLSYSDGFSQLADGSVDASIALAGYPTAAVIQTSTTNDLAFVPIDADAMKRILEAHSYYSAIDVPEGTYASEIEGQALGTRNILIVRADMSDERAYALTAAVYGNLEEFGAENAIAKQIVAEDAYGIAVPLHPGAKKFFDER